MSCDVITPHPPSVAGAASSSAAAAAAASATSLAPGFRFHPTDEELVSYYLKRKVLSRPFAVDAISEVDLYKAEPWDLPGKSRIQSRDMEWYFFSPLDKKYSNRSRTNRATGQGYWKTTGKDRPVRRASRTVGMKKTLVFHAGRAPKGQRTNWVMHEYRLEDEELIRAGVSQDAYVVCRIFQKSGPGPQNGAQYGAPLIEDEWEDDDRFLVQSDQGAGLPLLTFGDQLCTHSDDFEQKNVGMDDEQDSASPLLRSVGDQNIDVSPVNPTSLPAEAYENQFVNDVDENVNVLELNDDPYSIGVFDINSLSVSSQNDDTLIDDYLELNDLENPLETENFTQDADVLVTGIRNDQVPMDLLGNYNSLPDVHGVEEFFETEDGIGDLSEQEIATTSEDLYLNAKDMFTSDFPFGERADHGMVFDASSQNPIVEQGGFLEMNDFLDPVMVGSSAPDPVDEMIAYFDATEDNLQYPNIDNVDATSFFAEVERNSKEMYQPSPQASTENSRDGASSSTEVPFTFAKSKTSSDISFAGPDTLHESGWDTNTLKGRLINMLGSISSPPAIALESKAVALNTAAHTSGSIHIAAGMIQINGLPINGGGKHWPAPKSEDVGFLLSYDVTRTDVCTNPVGFEHVGKMHCNSLSLVIRSGFCLSFFSVLFLGVIFKIGAHIYSR